jgi:anaphase-promoting complex subunit 8
MPSKWLSICGSDRVMYAPDSSISTGRPVPDYAKSALYVARHHIRAVDGDLGLAREYLERVAASNSEEVAQAAELLKKIKAMTAAKALTEAEAQTKAANEIPVAASQPAAKRAADPEADSGPSIPKG